MSSKSRTESPYSVIVLYFRHGPDVASTVDRFLSQSVPPSEVIVVDNASHDGVCAQVFPSLEGSVRVVESPTNLGYAGGMRLGLRMVADSSGYVLFATHEVRLDLDAAESLIRLAVETGATQVGPALRNGASGETWSYGGTLNWRGSPKHLDGPKSKYPYEITWIDGCCFLAPNTIATREALSTRYFLYWEDVHFSRAVSRSGAVMIDPRVFAEQTTGTMPPYYSARNRVLYWRADRKYWTAAISTLEIIARSAATVVRPSQRSRASALWRGMLDGWTGRLRLVAKRW